MTYLIRILLTCLLAILNFPRHIVEPGLLCSLCYDKVSASVSINMGFGTCFYPKILISYKKIQINCSMI